MMPLIFSKTLHVTGVTIDTPQVTLLHNAARVELFLAGRFRRKSEGQGGAGKTFPGSRGRSVRQESYAERRQHHRRLDEFAEAQHLRSR